MTNSLSLDAVNTAISPPTLANEYGELKRQIKSAGLLEKQPLHYIYKISLIVGAFLLGLIFLFLTQNIWLELLGAVYLAIVLAQIAFIGHDAGHRQIFAKTWKNEIVGLFFGNLVIGMSNAWWVDKHNQHHSHPNELDLDPDLNIPGICFNLTNARNKRSLGRFVMRHQVFLFFPMLLLVAIDMKRTSLRFLFREWKQVRHPLTELLLILAHLLVPAALLIFFLGWWQAILFLIVNQALLGFILGSAFAPNHKGMPVLEKGSTLSFLRRQIITARNIQGHFFTDFWYGGLNYQIEHHLFPSMPRKNLGAAQIIIRNFCQERAIPYAETSIFGSYHAILYSLREVNTALRQEEQGIPA